jgi:hypothetical protein
VLSGTRHFHEALVLGYVPFVVRLDATSDSCQLRKHDNPAASPFNRAAKKADGVSRKREDAIAFRTRCKQRGAG